MSLSATRAAPYRPGSRLRFAESEVDSVFRSVFAKCLTAFFLIILCSFLLLSMVVTSIVSRYTESERQADVEWISASAATAIEETYQRTCDNGIMPYALDAAEEFVTELSGEYLASVEQVLCSLTRGRSSAALVLTDIAGEPVFVCRDGEIDRDTTGVPQPEKLTALTEQLLQEGTYEGTGNLGGLFGDEQYIYARVASDESDGTLACVYACVSRSEIRVLIGALNRTVIMASLWVMLAALIISYFISERITTPLRVVTAAAKKFARGHFNTRVTVSGDDEIADLAAAFNSMAESFARLDQTRSTFMANVAHDLRSPLTTIAGVLDSLQSGAIPPERRKHYYDMAAGEVRRLSRLVSDLLDITRMESGTRQFHFAEFNIAETARLVLISFEHRLEEKQLQVEMDCEDDPVHVYGDADALHQVLYNLMDNAIKFSREGGAFRIGVHRAEHHMVELSVFNEGCGIDPEEAPHVFERFYKSDKSRGLDKTGTGLGLYIVKTIVDAHHGQIAVQSRCGENCEFLVSLPATESAFAKRRED